MVMPALEQVERPVPYDISVEEAVLGSLLLVADLTVTAALSGWSAMAYFHAPKEHIAIATMLTRPNS